VLFQLPPGLHKDLERLDAFLAVLRRWGKEFRPAFEFRHASWFSDDVYASLRAAGAALCIAEAEKLETPLQATDIVGLPAPCAAKTTRPRRSTPGQSIAEQPWSEAYVFIKHERQRRLPGSPAARCFQFLNRPWRSESADRPKLPSEDHGASSRGRHG